MNKKIISFILSFFLLLNVASAIVIKNVNIADLTPGSESQLRISIENDENADIEDVSLSLDFSDLPLSTIGSSEDTIDELEEDESKTFGYLLRASNNAKPGDYNIPYKIKYEDKTKEGTIGIRINAKTDLTFSLDSDNAIIGSKGKVTLKIINKGFADAKFVLVRVFPEGLTLLSEKEVYIGNVNSDDFETASFDVIFKSVNSKLNAIVDYKDFDNVQKTKNVDLSLKVYTTEEAIELGIVQKSKTPLYSSIIIVLIIIWLIWRAIKKRQRMKNSISQER